MKIEKQSSLVPRLRFSEFRDTPVWTRTTLEEIGKFIGGGTPSTSIPEYWGGDIPWFVPSEVNARYLSVSKRTISGEGLRRSSANLLPAGTVLISSRATIGDVGIAENACATNQGFQSLVVYATEANVYWYYWFVQHKDELIKRAAGSTFLEIGKNELKRIPVVRPDKGEQQKIADCLGSLDDLISAQEQKLHVLRQHKQGLMQNLFPRPGETVPKLRFPEFRNRGVWQTIRFGDFVSNSKEKFNPMNSDDNPYLVELENIESRTGKLIGVAKLDKQNSLKSKFGAGDVLFGKLRPYLRKFAKPDYDGVCTTEIWVLRSNTVSSAFLFYLIQTDRFYQLANISSGSRMPRADWINLADANFQVPDRDERGRIADCLGSLDDLIGHADRKLQTLKQQKQGLMQQLFPTAENL